MQSFMVLAMLVSAADCAVNYCGAKMCGRSNAHTYCQYAPGPGPQCTGYIEDPLSHEEQARVLARLNRRRHEAAQGRLQQLPPAGNMLKLRWVAELAREAQLWADQCSPPSNPEDHDACRDLYSITVGQCVASVVGEAPGLRAESLVDTWYLQGLQFRGNVSTYANSKQNHMDFAQMLWAHTYLVGCARSRFMINGRMRTVIRLVCNMAPRGPAGALWLPAAPAAACPPRSRPDPELTGLCSYQSEAGDVYDASNETTLEEQTVLNVVLEIERNESLEHHNSLDEIYLTRMAIATLSHPTPTESYSNSIQKRDIIEPMFLDDKTHIDIARDKTHLIDNAIAKMVRERSTAKVTKLIKRASIVGRPKSYRIEDLNDLQDKSIKNARTQPVVTTTFNEENPYYDYGAQSQENVEPDEIITVLENEVKVTTTGNLSSTENDIRTEALTVTTLEPVLDNLTLEVNVTNDALKKLLELSKKTEEYPSDPQAALELQEALERMEMSLAAESSGKVRRELRRHPSEPQPVDQDAQNNEKTPGQVSETSNSQSPEGSAKNSSSAKAPVLSMMYKYFPFMKDYQQNLMGSSASSNRQLDLWFFVLVSFRLELFCRLINL